jgi:GNAT superfamily N-acetyltransferase
VVTREVEVEVVRPLRGAVLRPGRPPDATVWPLDDAPGTVHLAAYDADAGADPVGVVTLLPAPYPGAVEDEPAYQLRGMAVRPDLAGHGVGSALLAASVEAVRARGARLLWCNARTSAAGFYARHGFARDGAEFTPAELGIPHVRMRLPVG